MRGMISFDSQLRTKSLVKIKDLERFMLWRRKYEVWRLYGFGFIVFFYLCNYLSAKSRYITIQLSLRAGMQSLGTNCIEEFYKRIEVGIERSLLVIVSVGSSFFEFFSFARFLYLMFISFNFINSLRGTDIFLQQARKFLFFNFLFLVANIKSTRIA
jgi:hypothetical protein